MASIVPPPPAIPDRAALRAPSSKSATHRALVVAALAGGRSDIGRPLVADDTKATRNGLVALGIEVETRGAVWSVRGGDGVLQGGASVDAAASGTTLRLLTALAAIGQRPSLLGGVARLAERPIEPLLTALRQLGAHAVRAPAARGTAFVEAGGRPFRGGAVPVDATHSSQFASALLVIGASLPDGLDVSLRGRAVSLPYLALTVDMLARFGAVVRGARGRYRVSPSRLCAADVEIEGDWSSAAYLLAGAAIAGVTVSVQGLRPDSRQADVAILSVLRRAGVRVDRSADAVTVHGTGSLRSFEADFRNTPDLVPTAAVLALFCPDRSLLRGVAHLAGKESDRLRAIADAMAILGRTVRVSPDALIVEPALRPLTAGRVSTRGDHRIAMAFALAGLRLPGVEVDDTACVAKSYPDFWRDLEAIRTGTTGPPTSRRDQRPWS